MKLHPGVAHRSVVLDGLGHAVGGSCIEPCGDRDIATHLPSNECVKCVINGLIIRAKLKDLDIAPLLQTAAKVGLNWGKLGLK